VQFVWLGSKAALGRARRIPVRTSRSTARASHDVRAEVDGLGASPSSSSSTTALARAALAFDAASQSFAVSPLFFKNVLCTCFIKIEQGGGNYIDSATLVLDNDGLSTSFASHQLRTSRILTAGCLRFAVILELTVTEASGKQFHLADSYFSICLLHTSVEQVNFGKRYTKKYKSVVN
jgi:hypothetical protein